MSHTPQELSSRDSWGNGPHKPVDQSISIVTDQKQQSLVTEHRENTGEDVHSFVIVKDIDVEEELSKAQKDNKNFFQVLSMSFYGKVKSHSVDNQETRDLQKFGMSPQGGPKTAFPRKASAHTPSESSKREGLKNIKPTTQGTQKKPIPLVQDLQLNPEHFRKHLLSPKDSSTKAYSPVVVGKNHLGANKDSPLPGDSPQHRPQTWKKVFNLMAENSKRLGNTECRTPLGNQTSPLRDDIQSKISFFQLPKKSQKTGERVEDKIQKMKVDLSNFGIPLQELGKAYKGKERDKSDEKDASALRKKSSGRESEKLGQDKSTSANNSGRSLPSSGSSRLKSSSKETSEVRRLVLENEGKHDTTPVGMKANKDLEQYFLKLTDKKKCSSLLPKPEKTGEDLQIVDLQDLDNDLKRLGRESPVSHTSKGGAKNRQSSLKLEKQKSPVTIKLQERIPMALNGGIGNWVTEALMIPVDDIDRKGREKEKYKESDTPGAKKGNSQSLKKTLKGKTSSAGKLSKAEPQGKSVYTPKFDLLRLKEDKNTRLFEVYGAAKEKKEKGRPASPAVEENQQRFDLLDYLLSQNRREKIDIDNKGFN